MLFTLYFGGGAQKSLVAKYSVLMTHDCFLEIEGEGEKKIFNQRTPDTKQHFTFVVVKKITFYR